MTGFSTQYRFHVLSLEYVQGMFRSYVGIFTYVKSAKALKMKVAVGGVQLSFCLWNQRGANSITWCIGV